MIIAIIITAIGIGLVIFGIWGIVCWDKFTELSSDAKEIIENIRL
jgi:hypothetical protein